jgi:hypothetical protein
MNLARKLWQRGLDLFPVSSFHFDRPLVLLQSDDWGRVGLRDQDGLEQLQAAGVQLGERPYDFYSLETAEDLTALSTMLKKHRDSVGRHPCLEMNFIVANLDFAPMKADGEGRLHLLPLADGLPQGWKRPNLIESYKGGISDGIFKPALHGMTHFCRQAVERHVLASNEGGRLLHALWAAGTPYIHWRMPWIGYEYWDPEMPDEQRFLTLDQQRQFIGQAVGAFAKLFSSLPRSACAPGYRANDDTHRAWAEHGIRVAQNGPGSVMPPHFDRNEILHLSRIVEFEPAIDPAFSIDACLRRAKQSFDAGIPAIISVHSINFHSAVRDFRSSSLQALDEFLTALESKYSGLLYLHSEDLHDLVTKGRYSSQPIGVHVNMTKKNFTRAGFALSQNVDG